MYIDMHLGGRDKRGRRRSAAIPPNELPREHVSKCDNTWALKTIYAQSTY